MYPHVGLYRWFGSDLLRIVSKSGTPASQLGCNPVLQISLVLSFEIPFMKVV